MQEQRYARRQPKQREERSIYIGPSFDAPSPARGSSLKSLIINALVYGLDTADEERSVLDRNGDLEKRARDLMRREDAPVGVESELERYVKERL